MIVFIVVHGESGNGGEVRSVHFTFKLAKSAALKIKRCFDGGWVQEEKGVWSNGCDFVAVKEFEVQE